MVAFKHKISYKLYIWPSYAGQIFRRWERKHVGLPFEFDTRVSTSLSFFLFLSFSLLSSLLHQCTTLFPKREGKEREDIDIDRDTGRDVDYRYKLGNHYGREYSQRYNKLAFDVRWTCMNV